jgi:hypothetical protein
MKQTAIEWLVEELPILKIQLLEKVVAKAKEMEKEQILNAFENGEVCTLFKNEGASEQYYNETFKSE